MMAIVEDLSEVSLRHCVVCDVFWVGDGACWFCGQPCPRCNPDDLAASVQDIVGYSMLDAPDRTLSGVGDPAGGGEYGA